jgi:hypothetical protein
VLRADWDAVMPMTGPSPATRHARAISAMTRVLPAPAGALITDTRRPSASTDSAAAAWSSRSPEPVRASLVSPSAPGPASKVCSSRARSAPSAAAASGRVMRGAVRACACATMASSMLSCARVA